MRIVSLLPSATEILYLLGLGDSLVGVSHECDFPVAATGKARIIRPAFETAGHPSAEIDKRVRDFLQRGEHIYRIDTEALHAVDPDLIVTQELCDVCAAPYQDVLTAVERLPRKPDVVSLDPRRLRDVLEDIRRVGEATGRSVEAEEVVASLRERIARVAERSRTAEDRPTVACLEWLHPIMASGHWIPEMVTLAGGREPIGAPGSPSRSVSWAQVLSAAPEVLVLMPCGFSVPRVLQEVHVLTRLSGWPDLPAVRKGRVFAVNSHAYFSRPGPRLIDGVEILAHLVHPELFPGPVPEGAIRRLAG